MNLNLVIIAGRVTQDAEQKNLPGGQSLAKFSVATNNYWTDRDGQKKEATEFHNIVMWGKKAETLSQYIKKGTLVVVEGTLRTNSWDGEDGKKRYKTEIMVNNIQLGPKASGAYSKDDFADIPAKPKQQQEEESLPVIQAGEEVDSKDSLFIDDDDIDSEEIPF